MFAGLFVFDAADGQQPEIVLGIKRRLVPVGSDFLLEITALVEQPHGDQRDAQVAGRLEVVAGKHAETAGVNGQTFVNTVLGRKVGDGRRGRQFGNRLVERRLHVGVESFQGAAVKLHVSFVLRQLDKSAMIGFPQQLDSVVTDFVPQGRIDAAEQRLVFRMPSPPEIVRQFVEAAQLVRELDRTGETVQQRRHRRRAGEDARQDLVVHARNRPRGHALAGLIRGEGVGVVVVLIKGGPVGLFGQRAGGGAAFRQRFLRQRSQLAHQRGQFFDRRLVRRVAAFEDDDAFVLALLARPKAEARQIAGDGRHGVGRGLLRRVAPRLVPRGEEPRVAGR